MQPGRAADHSPTSSFAVMEEYSYTSTHPLGHIEPVTGSLLVAIYRIQIHVSALYVGHHQVVQRTY